MEQDVLYRLPLLNIAKGMDILTAVEEAKQYLWGAINAKLDIGKGRGPLNHLYNI